MVIIYPIVSGVLLFILLYIIYLLNYIRINNIIYGWLGWFRGGLSDVDSFGVVLSEPVEYITVLWIGFILSTPLLAAFLLLYGHWCSISGSWFSYYIGWFVVGVQVFEWFVAIFVIGDMVLVCYERMIDGPDVSAVVCCIFLVFWCWGVFLI